MPKPRASSLTPKGRPLRPEERALWGHVAKSVQPLPGKVHPPTDDLPHAPVPGEKKQKAAHRPQPLPHNTGVLHKREAPRPTPELQASLDGATERKLKRGKAQVDAKLDLHGMRQHQAHEALIRFIHFAQSRGHRCVLVITGKGTRGPGHTNPYETPGPGILKTRLSQWLAQEPLRNQTYGLREAHPRHGGAGAHYVFIRKIKR